ncbi:hypothetical protein ACCD10_30710 [Pseudomonas sp. Pseusp122]|uniref:hypothetical protein n=1 Tax=unclassified Pseudomonas TaxID=196821 RepID=UPI0039A6D65E
MKNSTFWKVFAAPTAIAVLTLAGLFAALLGDGAWDSLSWLAMGISTVVSLKGLLTRKKLS